LDVPDKQINGDIGKEYIEQVRINSK